MPAVEKEAHFLERLSFSKVAFILNWLDFNIFRLLVWHDYKLKRSDKERRGTPASSAGVVPRVPSPEAAAEEGATTLDWRVFPLLLLLCWLQNCWHTWLCIFLFQLEEVQPFSSIMLQMGIAIVASLGSKDNYGPDYSPAWPNFTIRFGTGNT